MCRKFGFLSWIEKTVLWTALVMKSRDVELEELSEIEFTHVDTADISTSELSFPHRFLVFQGAKQ